MNFKIVLTVILALTLGFTLAYSVNLLERSLKPIPLGSKTSSLPVEESAGQLKPANVRGDALTFTENRSLGNQTYTPPPVPPAETGEAEKPLSSTGYSVKPELYCLALALTLAFSASILASRRI